MIGWLNPAAFAGLALLVLPVLVHLLRTHRAERIMFPSLRFVTPSRTAAVRLRPPTDALLLLVRLAIAALAVVALARPVFVTAARQRAWNGRTARAIVIDASAAMRVGDAAGKRPEDEAREAAAAEVRSAAEAVRIDSAVLRDGVVRALEWLAAAPPARREIVVISAFTAGAFRESDVADVPSGVGIRLVRVGGPVETRRVDGASLFAAPGASRNRQEILLTGPRTGVTAVPEALSQSGLRLVGVDPGSGAVQRLWRAVAAAGAPSPSADQPLACQFGSDAAGLLPAPIDRTTPRWMLRTLLRLQNDRSLQEAGRSVSGSSLTSSDPWTVVSADAEGRPLVRVAAAERELLLQIGAPADSFIAAAAIRAVLVARGGDGSHPEQEILRTPAATLAAWSRPAAEIDHDLWRRVDRSDGRWFWAAALLLLGVEQRLRRSPPATPAEVRDAA